ncbi:MAG: 3-hydroxyacyl-ACP dehydratase FabZ family protein [Pseudolabrys sp.]
MRLEYFQLIDRVIEFNLADRKISTEATVPTASTIFEGHFPGNPLMPGVLLLETMAQTSGWLLLAMNRCERAAYLAAVKEAKFRGFVRPGERLTAEAKLAHEGSGYAVTEARILKDGKQVCDATLTMRVLEFPNAEMEQQVRNLATQIGLTVEARADG